MQGGLPFGIGRGHVRDESVELSSAEKHFLGRVSERPGSIAGPNCLANFKPINTPG